MFFWTETPEAKMWELLTYLESPLNVFSLMTGTVKSNRKHIFDTNTASQKCHFISSCIRQAKEYFYASKSVGLETKPLLMYYGINCLAKSLIVMNLPEVNLEEFRYHGLQLVHGSVNPNKIESTEAMLKDGLFQMLWGLENDFKYEKGSTFNLKEILSCCPDLHELYCRHYNEKKSIFYISKEPSVNSSGNLTFKVNKRDISELENALPKLNELFNRADGHDQVMFTSILKNSELNNTSLLVPGTLNGYRLVRPTKNGMGNQICVIYAGMFIISNLVRYYPKEWIQVVEGKDSGIISLVMAFTNYTMRRYVNETLEKIWSEKMTYATPAYIS